MREWAEQAVKTLARVVALAAVVLMPSGAAGAAEEVVPQLGFWDSVDAVAFSPDGRLVVTGDRYDSFRLWDLASGTELRRFQGHTNRVRSVSFSPNGRMVLTGSDDETARLWDVSSGKELRRFEGHRSSVDSVSYSPDGRTVLTVGDKTARLWDAGSGNELRCFERYSNWHWVLSGSFSPDGRTVVTGDSDETARLWDVDSGRELRRLEGHSKLLSSARFSPDGRMIVTGSADKTARIWDAGSGKELLRFEGHSGWVRSVSFSPDGRMIVTGSADKTARLWDAGSGKELRRLEGHDSAVTEASFSPDGRLVLTGSQDGTAHLWDAATGARLATLIPLKDGWLAMTPQGYYTGSPGAEKYLAVVDGKTVKPESALAKYHQPDLVAAALSGGAKVAAPEPAAPVQPAVVTAPPKPPEPPRLDLPLRLETTLDHFYVTGRVAGGRDGVGLTVAGQRVTVAPDGAFSVALTQLLPGDNPFEVVAEGPGGRQAVTLTVARSAPAVIGAVRPQRRRLALVVANSAYGGLHGWGGLPSVVNDGSAMEAVLRDHGFEIYQNRVFRDLDRQALDGVVADFSAALEKETQPAFVLFYFSGHGTAVDSRNYLVPVGAPHPQGLTGKQAGAQYVGVDKVFRTLHEEHPHRTTLLIVDACRDDVNTKGPIRVAGKAATEPAPGFARQSVATSGGAIIYATAPGYRADPGDETGLSRFTDEFVKRLRGSPATLFQVLTDTTAEVSSRYGQLPWHEGDVRVLNEVMSPRR